MTQGLLFSATARSVRVAIGPATDLELAAIARPVPPEAAHDVLLPWMLISVRAPGGIEVSVHALGWRLLLANTWITSKLLAADMECGAVNTSSGKTYTLVDRIDGQLPPSLHDHLGYALRLWGYDDVTAA